MKLVSRIGGGGQREREVNPLTKASFTLVTFGVGATKGCGDIMARGTRGGWRGPVPARIAHVCFVRMVEVKMHT
jgi:hypothetical protein